MIGAGTACGEIFQAFAGKGLFCRMELALFQGPVRTFRGPSLFSLFHRFPGGGPGYAEKAGFRGESGLWKGCGILPPPAQE